MATAKLNRRQLLELVAAGGASAALAVMAGGTSVRAAPTGGRAPALAAWRSAQGGESKLVIVSVFNPEQNAPLIQAIQQANPGVSIEWRFLPSERFVELFTAAEVAGDQIDIMDLNGQDLRRYAVGGKLLDLTDIPYKGRFREIALRTYTIGGKLWALPRGGISGFPFFYNNKALQKIGVTSEPATYEELRTVAQELQKAGIAPFVHPGKNIYLWPVWQFWAYAQTSGNKSVENTIKTLNGEMKFTDPEHVAALEILYRFAQDRLFVENVNSLDNDGAMLTFNQGQGGFFYFHTWYIGENRRQAGQYPELDLGLMPPVRSVADAQVKRENPGGTGTALGIYARIAPERLELARSVIDLMTSDTWVKWANDLNKDPVSCNQNVQASDDPLALKYAEQCAPNQTIYLDWYWPPEITRAFQEHQQAIVAGTEKPDQAAQAIQAVLDNLYKDGYKFQT